MANPIELQLYTESSLSNPVTSRLLACNPTVDLLATGSDANVLNIWRAHGQLVAKHVERTAKIETLRWKPDGHFLAAGWSDGVMRLVGFENAKAAHQLSIFEKGQSKFAFIAWSRNNIPYRDKIGIADANNGSWTKHLDEDSDAESNDGVLDLPNELTFIEVDTALPKLSPLPVSGGSGADMLVFTTRNSIDFIFRPFKASDSNKVDVTMVGTNDGRIQISIYDSFTIGSFRLAIPDRQPSSKNYTAEACAHSSHPDISTHVLLFKTEVNESVAGYPAVYMVPVDLTFVHSCPVNLSLLASKTTMLQNILRYIKQTQVHMVGEWKSTRELPARFMAGIQEDLEKQPKGRNIVQALYHTVVTGHVYPPVKEWLVDSLAERGHKRWDKAVTSGLENLRALTHENMMPALQRAAIILSRLRGIARFEESSNDIGFSAAQISRLVDIVQSLYAMCYKVLRLVMKELVLFAKFSSWLRLEIDKLASSTMTDELLERQANVDFSKVLVYIKGHLTTSPMAIFFDDVEKRDYTKELEQAEDGTSLREILEKQIRRQQTGQPYIKALPQLEFLVDYLTDRSEVVLGSIAETQRRRVRMAPATKLEIDGNISRYDVRLCGQKKRASGDLGGIVYTALASDKAPSDVQIFKSDLEIINGISNPVRTGRTGISISEGRILDFKFLDEQSLLLLWLSSDSVLFILNIPFRSLHSYPVGAAPGSVRLDAKNIASTVSMAKVPVSAGFTPIHMEVVQRTSQRGEIPARVCLLGKDRVTYKVYALPRNWEPRVDLSLQEDINMDE